MNPLLTLTVPLVVTAAVTAAVATAVTGAQAAAPASPATKVAVTIAGNDGPYGEVRSPRRVCKAEVTVKLLRQIGTRGGGNDVRVGSPDTTGLQSGRWTYSFGNPGLEDGWKVYAKVPAHDGCKAASSPTMTVDKD